MCSGRHGDGSGICKGVYMCVLYAFEGQMKL